MRRRAGQALGAMLLLLSCDSDTRRAPGSTGVQAAALTQPGAPAPGASPSPAALEAPPAAAPSTTTTTTAAATPAPSATAMVLPGVQEQMASIGRARVIINLHDPVPIGTEASLRQAAVARVQAAVLARLSDATYQPLRRWELVPGLAGFLTAEGLARVIEAPEVHSVQVDDVTQATLKESVPAIHGDTVRTMYGYRGGGVTVAVIDTGVDLNHKDTGPAVTAQQCFTFFACPPNNTLSGSNAQDDHGHGTNVSGIVTSDGVDSPIGFAPDTGLVAVKVLDKNGSGFLSDWVSGLNWILNNNGTLKVNVINMSLGSNTLYGGANCDASQQSAANAIAQLTAANVMVFAASGNAASTNSIAAPGCCGATIAIGATYDSNMGGLAWSNCTDNATSLDTITCFTNSSAKVAMLAPGSQITAARWKGGSITYSGTSQATPTAAAVAALIIGIDPTFKRSDIVSWMQASGPLLTDPKNKLQFPRIDALAAVQLALANTCAGKKDGTPCDDGDKCTTVDTCQAGKCAGGAPVKCVAKDQCHDVGKCDPPSGKCSDPSKADSSPCDDLDLCTQKDTCQAGVCVGAMPVVCVAKDQCHDAGVCDVGTGKCSDPSKPDQTLCNDGSACTRKDTCQAGVCLGADPVICVARDQCHDVGTCDPQSGTCSNPNRPDGAGCDDGTACTRSDTCQGGACQGKSPVVCVAMDQCHRVGDCDPQSGACSNPLAVDGAGCDDGDACTRKDSCQAGVCTGAQPVACAALDACHVAGACDPKTGACSNPAGNEGATCDDGELCSHDDRCAAGKCAGVAFTCAATACQSSSVCDGKGGCTTSPLPDGVSCNDSNVCTRSDVCRGGVCSGENAVTCPAAGACQLAVKCDPTLGECVITPAPDGTTCPGGACSAGVCVKAGGCGCDVGAGHGPGPTDGGPLAALLLVALVVNRRRLPRTS